MIRASSIPTERAAGKLIAAPPKVSEKPMLFSAEMVKAILSGTKTVTRRALNPQPSAWATEFGVSAFTPPGMLSARGNHPDHGPSESFIKRRWTTGGRIWIRETWQTWTRQSDGCGGIRFRADDAFMPIENTRKAADLWIDAHDNGTHGTDWRPSIFMPRWASRIYLEITGVNVERLQAITEEQAKAEGVTTDPVQGTMNGKPATLWPMTHRQAFIWLWDAINKDRAPWASNPFVWCVSFRKVTP